MAYYSPTSRVLRFADGAQPEHWVAKRQDDTGRMAMRWIAVPALAWTVQAELRTTGPLNALQRAVLTLCHMGIVQVQHQADATGLDPALIGFLIKELTGEGFLNAHGELSERGQKALREDRELPVRTVQLHAFQDPWTGELWPRVVKRLEDAVTVGEVGGGEDGRESQTWPRLDMSSPGRDRTVAVAFLQLPRADVVAPQLRAIGTAVETGLAVGGGGEQLTLAGKPEDAIVISSDRAEPVWIVTQIYVPENETLERRWRVADPFASAGDLAWLRRRLREIATKGRGNGFLLSTLSSLVGEDVADNLVGEAEELRVLQRFGTDLNYYPDLKEFIENLLAAESCLTAPMVDRRQAKRAVNSAATSCGKALEYALPLLLNVFPVRGGVERAFEALERGLVELGWGQRPHSWNGQTLNRGSDRLVALLAQTGVAAVQHRDHPLRRWLGRGRKACDLDQLRSWRNHHSHDNRNNRTSLDSSQHLHHIEAALDLFEVLLPVLPKEQRHV